MNQILSSFLIATLFIVGSGPDSVMASPEVEVVGLHVLTNFPTEHILVTESPVEADIVRTIRGLDWRNGFHQVILVTSPGVSMEVGGSLKPGVGLSSVYRDLDNRIYRVTRYPPKTAVEMEKILLSFHAGDNEWEEMYIYDLVPY
jgi:hypothetical protein